MVEEMLEVPPDWNEVSDLMMEEEDFLPEAAGSTKRKRDEVTRGQRKRQKEDDIRPEKRGHCPQYLGEYKIQRDSILNVRMKVSREKTNGNHQRSGKASYRWCFAAEV